MKRELLWDQRKYIIIKLIITKLFDTALNSVNILVTSGAINSSNLIFRMSYPAVHDLRLDSPNYGPPPTGLYANGQPYPANGARGPNFSPPISPRNQYHNGNQLHKINDDRSVTVSGQSEYLIEPDTFEIIVLIRSAKPSIEEVKASVSKRKDYIVSVAQQNKVLYRVSSKLFCNSHFIKFLVQ